MERNEFFFDVFFLLDIGEEKTNTTKHRNRRKNYYFVQEKLALLFFLRVKLLLRV